MSEDERSVMKLDMEDLADLARRWFIDTHEEEPDTVKVDGKHVTIHYSKHYEHGLID